MEGQLGGGGVPENLNFFIRVRTRSSALPTQTGNDFERSYLARSLIKFAAGLQYPMHFLAHTKKTVATVETFVLKKDVMWDFSVVGQPVIWSAFIVLERARPLHHFIAP